MQYRGRTFSTRLTGCGRTTTRVLRTVSRLIRHRWLRRLIYHHRLCRWVLAHMTERSGCAQVHPHTRGARRGLNLGEQQHEYTPHSTTRSNRAATISAALAGTPYLRACVHACMRACARARVRMCVRACACVCARGGHTLQGTRDRPTSTSTTILCTTCRRQYMHALARMRGVSQVWRGVARHHRLRSGTCTHASMHAQMRALMRGRTDGRPAGRTESRTNARTNARMDAPKGARMHGRTD